MTDERTMKLIIDEQYMADLLSEELCTDALADLKVSKVSQSGGVFHIEFEPKKVEGE